MDRQDIDALLVGALYGELTPADEARLTAHLESHPGDRGALDDLKSARAKVRESRIFDLQTDPPQHISALLLQEAHRRAPKMVVADDGERKDSWFWRFARSFALHPAMAAAAMLVVVLGVGAVIYNKKGSDFAQREAPTSSQPSKVAQETAANNEGPNTVVPTTDMPAAGSAAPMDNFQAGLAEGQDLANDRGANHEGAGGDKQDQTAATRWRSDSNADSKAAAPSKNKGIVVTTEQPQPKDFESDRAERAADESKLAKESEHKAAPPKKSDEAVFDLDGARDDVYGAPTTGTAAPGRGGATGAGAGAGGGGNTNGLVVGGVSPGAATPSTPPRVTTTAPKGNAAAGPSATPTAPSANRPMAQPPPPAPAEATTAKTTSKPDAAKPTTTATVKQDPAKTAAKTETATKSGSSTATPDTTAKKVATQKPPADKAPAPAQQTAPDPVIAWAKQQHARAIALAKNGDCKTAAQVALGVSQKTPDYYASYMASDRQLKSCKAYIDDARDREAEKSAKSRAQKRVNADEAAPANSAK